MKINEIINGYHSQVVTKNLPDSINGGRIDTEIVSSNGYKISSYSYTYTNKKIEQNGPVISVEVNLIDETSTVYHYIRYPEGILWKNTDDDEIRQIFAQGVSEYFNKRIEEGNRIMNKINDPWSECSELREFRELTDYIIEQAKITRNLVSQRKLEEVNSIKRSLANKDNGHAVDGI